MRRDDNDGTRRVVVHFSVGDITCVALRMEIGEDDDHETIKEICAEWLEEQPIVIDKIEDDWTEDDS